MSKRPSPEKLLLQVQEEERHIQQGKLKIYFGASPGVGKTYTMLQDAAEKRAQGLDVVAGVVESHGRKEIEKLITNLEQIPLKEVIYRDKSLLEFDLDAILKRNPALVLIDEMAHTNAPGLRHQKRWQDIKEVLDRGIDVYTTLNVQHIESINDDVSQIIGADIKETVPDSMLEIADTIELIDLPAEDLLKRLQEGKVYVPDQAKLAAEHFFKKDTLTALREFALRVTAERVGAQVLLYRAGETVKHIWPSKEKILVCIGPSIESLHLIRIAKRIANSLHTEWIAIYIETPKLKTTTAQRNRAISYLQLAEQLGADSHVLTGFDMVKGIMNFAKENYITQIIIGKKIQPRWKNLLFKSLADEVVRFSEEIDVYVMTSAVKPNPPKKELHESKVPWGTYAIALGMVIITSILNFLLFPFLKGSNLIMIYLLGIIAVSLFAKVGPSIFASVLSVLVYDFFFIPPFYSFAISDIQYLFTLLVMLLVAQVISNLMILTRRLAHSSFFIQHQTSILHKLSRKLAQTRGINKLLDTSVQFLGETFHCQILALIPQNPHLAIMARYQTEIILDDKEQSIAQWVYEMGQKAGFGTQTLSFSKALYLPLLTSRNVLGVLRIQPWQENLLFTPEEMRLLEACAYQIAITLEVDKLHEINKKTELNAELEEMRNFIFSKLAYYLRFHLNKAIQSTDTLFEEGKNLNSELIQKNSKNISIQLRHIQKLIENPEVRLMQKEQE